MKALAVVWAVVGVVVMLMYAVLRMSVHAFAALEYDLSVFQLSVLLINCAFMAYSEGYKGFHLSFSPRFAARAKYIYRKGDVWQMLMSPLFCFGYFGTTRAKQVIAFILTGALVTLVVFMRYMPQPWRGILDAGVVVGLSLGIISLIVCVIKEFSHDEYVCDPQVPGLQIK